MLDELSPEQFDEWMTYFNMEPWGDQHRQNAKLIAGIFNSQGGKKGGKAFTEDDFMPKIIRHRDVETEQKLHLEHWKRWVSSRGGNVSRS